MAFLNIFNTLLARVSTVLIGKYSFSQVKGWRRKRGTGRRLSCAVSQAVASLTLVVKDRKAERKDAEQ